ncbi:FRG domain-containing protein [Arvimicrobium flavum]|uniref:FRG domain-containing protein n=1 Tax=Arvimicrobium flavum TaxID=3393320 RepID=UPI00398C9C18
MDGLEGLLQTVLRIARDLPEGGFLWYRGHASSGYSLLPGLLREGRPSTDVFDREKRLLTRFRQRSLPYWPAGYPQNDWEHLFAMQHHGVPTRLLDWSENMFIAAHFAIADDAREENLPVVWCIDPISWNRSTPVLSEYGNQIHVLTTSDDESEPYRPETTRRRLRSPVAIFGTHNSSRIVAQRGTFMVWGDDPRCLEDFASEGSSALWRVAIKGDRSELRKQLNTIGFVETMVYPELVSLATELSRVEGWRT